MGTGWSQDQEASESKVSETAKHSSDNGDNKAGEPEKLKLSAVHDFENILGNSDFRVEYHSSEQLLTYLRQGLLLNHNRLKYWVDKNGKNGFTVYARDLSVTWAENYHYWIWHKLDDASDESSVEVVELRDVCWLEVRGRFDTRKMSPRTLYQVTFVVMLKQQCYGWDIPVNVTLELPDGGKEERKVDMSKLPKGQWVEIVAGSFTTSPKNHIGDVKFSVHEFDGGQWKRGLVIKGVKIHPKTIYG